MGVSTATIIGIILLVIGALLILAAIIWWIVDNNSWGWALVIGAIGVIFVITGLLVWVFGKKKKKKKAKIVMAADTAPLVPVGTEGEDIELETIAPTPEPAAPTDPVAYAANARGNINAARSASDRAEWTATTKLKAAQDIFNSPLANGGGFLRGPTVSPVSVTGSYTNPTLPPSSPTA